ncbi:acyltransferase [Corticibacter populi]|uniref:Acyltransferase n=1 Tax=Corticibacter populi TaxID=1550736 RepID=A0A3M6QKB7_9BURK|nr:acyltransferase [Corticibacter populi]RMX03528.1 acyltransferase [Corticibacter populi]RZS29978.1 acetyltransferase-like isoleucine patch superfamily enzyme [Corticibacter populi]
MKHRIKLPFAFEERLPEFAATLQVEPAQLHSCVDWMLAQQLLFNEGGRYWLCSVEAGHRISDPLTSRFYALLKQQLPTHLVPRYGRNWATLKDRWLRAWEQAYNILINKIPSHHVRIAWLRLGGARIGKGSSVWRNTEVLGIENLVIGEDSVVSWHGLLDARAGLVIGDHVAIASHVLIIAGSHDVMEPEFWSISGPIYIDDYAWIATRATIGFGLRVGRGSVVTACTLVSKDIAPYAIVGGSGAKVMGHRPEDLRYRVGGKGLFTLFH